MEQQVLITDEEVARGIDYLADKILKTNKPYDYLIGIANGGLPVSNPLFDKLVPTWKELKGRMVRVSFYSDKNLMKFPREVDLRAISTIKPNSRLLFVDDLVDNGYTMRFLKDHLSDYFTCDFAVLYYRKLNKKGCSPTYFYKPKPEGWLVFPWEEPLKTQATKV